MASLTTIPFGTAYTYYFAGIHDGRVRPPGRWLGEGSSVQGLCGEATFLQASWLFGDGLHPDRDRIIGEKLQAGWSQSNAEAATTLGQQRPDFAGFDLTVTPPKSVSIFWGIGGKDARELVDIAQSKAVNSTVAFVEKHALMTREGVNGIAQTPLPSGVLAAGFRHYTSRRDNPEIHDHILISSKAQNEKGHWKVLDAPHFQAWFEATEEHYNTALLHELTAQGIGFVRRPVEDSNDVTWEIAGIDEALIIQFSDHSPSEGAGPQL